MIHFGRRAEQGAANEQRGFVARHMGEGVAAVAVADGPDAAIAGAQPFIDRDAMWGEGDAGLVEIELVDVGLPSGGDHQMRALDTLAALENDGDTGAGA